MLYVLFILILAGAQEVGSVEGKIEQSKSALRRVIPSKHDEHFSVQN